MKGGIVSYDLQPSKLKPLSDMMSREKLEGFKIYKRLYINRKTVNATGNNANVE